MAVLKSGHQSLLEDVPLRAFAALVIILLILSRLTWKYVKARFQFPGPAVKKPWIGNLDQTMANDVHEKWVKWNRQYGHVYQTWNGLFSRVVYIGDPDMIMKIAMANWPKASIQYEGFKPLNGNALFVQLNHDRWRIQRKRLEPAFQHHVIRGQHEAFSKHLENYLQHLDNAAEDHTVQDFAELHVLLTIDIIGDIGFGNDIHALSQGSECRVLQLFDTILPELMKCGLFPLRAKIPILKSTRKMWRAIKELRGLAEDSIARTRQKNETSNKAGNKIFEILAEQREADGSYTFTPTELCDNYCAFLVAGGDPTANAMSFVLYEVLRNPDVLSLLRNEIDANIPYGTLIPSLEQIKNLPYLDMVIKEALRLHPSGFGTFRTCAVDTEVQGVTLPAKTTLALWNTGVHRDPTLWEDPDSFQPERWRDGRAVKTGAYFPFSYGPRSCLGQKLAMFELNLVLATVFRRYDLALEPGFEMEYLASFSLKPNNGLPVRVSRRSS